MYRTGDVGTVVNLYDVPESHAIMLSKWDSQDYI